MKRLALLISAAACCAAPPRANPAAPLPAVAEHPAPAPSAPPEGAVTSPPETLTADSQRTTAEGATFIAPAGWTIRSRDKVIILDAPEAGSHIALVDVRVADPDAAVAGAWTLYDPAAHWTLDVANDESPMDGWDRQRSYSYETSAAQHRIVRAEAFGHAGLWTVRIDDLDRAVAQKRVGQTSTLGDHLQPVGYQRESFAGVKANVLDAARVDALRSFVATAQEELGVPGAAFGLVQDGKVVFAGGLGVRELGKKAPVDADTLFMIASNTKAMTTLLLATLVDEKKLGWETPVTQLLPDFKLGDAETTRQVLVKHLVCACTGLPRQDLEWLMEFQRATPRTELATLATVQPTSKFGEMFQYSNLLAAAAGFVAAHVIEPGKELGVAYDDAMRARVFAPLGMKATTFDFRRALGADHAGGHAFDVDGRPAVAVMDLNYSIVPLRPAGGAWSSVKDVLRYVQLELGDGVLDGKRVLSKEALLARRASQVKIGNDVDYGMGLETDHRWGIPVVHHGGSMIGFKTDMIWLPDQQVGAVILTNADSGGAMLRPFQRRLLEVLFDGKPKAQADLAAAAAKMRAEIAAERKRLTVPADPREASTLAARYRNPALGTIDVRTDSRGTVFDFGEFKSEVASRKNEDGTRSLVTIVPGFDGEAYILGSQDGHRTLTLLDSQHTYVFTEVAK